MGKNAQRMLLIGQIQDSLEELGFEKVFLYEFYHKQSKTTVWFFTNSIHVFNTYDEFDYNEENLQDKVVNFLKDLMNAR